MTHPNKLLSTASILALALTLSACGSNSNDTSDAPTPADPYKTATDLTALSSDDPQEAGSALMKATEAAEKIDAIGSNGDSNAAIMNAQAVLDARTELEDAKSSAEKVLEDLPDTPENAAERYMLEEAIMAAEEVLAGEKVLDEKSLVDAIEDVTGDNEDEPKTAEDVGQDVAAAVLAAFDSANGVVIGRAAPRSLDASDDQSAVTGMTSSGGKTFREIFNSDVTDYALGAEGALVPTISIAGEDFEPTGVTEGDKFAQGANPLMGMAHGIEGSFHCVGAGCEFKEGKLVGSWVFTPSEATSHYVAMEGGDVYTEVQHVWYGHWLDKSPDGSMDRIRATARLGNMGNKRPTSARSQDWGTIPGEDASATYSGNAVGRSVRHEFATDGEVAATHSGSFTADVDLTATFGASPMLEGKVSGFSAVDNAKAVNTGWEVTLEETAVIGSILGAGFNNGVAKGKGSDEDGTWIADSYLDEGSEAGFGVSRPDGIYGAFDADFTDGQAAGAFATRKDN